MTKSTSFRITHEVLEQWKNTPEAKFDALCVERGRLIRSGVSIEEVNRLLPLPKKA